MTPRMVRMEGVNTPPNVPNLLPAASGAPWSVDHPSGVQVVYTGPAKDGIARHQRMVQVATAVVTEPAAKPTANEAPTLARREAASISP